MVFIIIMTLRQAMAIILSCIIYSHPITATGVFGVILVFGAMFLKIYCGQKLRKLKAAREALAKASGAAPKTLGGEGGEALMKSGVPGAQLHPIKS